MGDGFAALERLLFIASKRHGVIASNIANADTPDYKAKDIKFDDVLEGEGIAARVTHPSHIPHKEGLRGVGIVIETMPPWKDKNNVELDMEVAKMTENALLFQAGITMLTAKMRMFRNALRR
jgi:flagellar basal-body rod protein FlgB